MYFMQFFKAYHCTHLGWLLCSISSTYKHDKVLHLLATRLVSMFVSFSYIHVYADLPGLRPSEGPQATVLSDLLITSYKPDIVVHNSEASAVALLELTCLLDSEHHLQAARYRK